MEEWVAQVLRIVIVRRLFLAPHHQGKFKTDVPANSLDGSENSINLPA